MSAYARDRGEHQRRPAGERDAGGLWQASPGGEWPLSALEEAATSAWAAAATRPVPAEWRISGGAALCGARSGDPQLSARGPVDGPAACLPEFVWETWRWPCQCWTREKIQGAMPRGCHSDGGGGAGLSSPVRILRDKGGQCSVREPTVSLRRRGARYAGGILSAAADGMRCAEKYGRYTADEKKLR